jgi:protein TonB
LRHLPAVAVIGIVPIVAAGQAKQLEHVAPVYPDIARQARVQGVAILERTISPQGRVSAARVTLNAVKQGVYTPTLLNGVPVPVIMTVTVNFKLS